MDCFSLLPSNFCRSHATGEDFTVTLYPILSIYLSLRLCYPSTVELAIPRFACFQRGETGLLGLRHLGTQEGNGPVGMDRRTATGAPQGAVQNRYIVRVIGFRFGELELEPSRFPL